MPCLVWQPSASLYGFFVSAGHMSLVQSSSVETPVPLIIKQHWVSLQVPCVLYVFSGWLSHYINMEFCVMLSVGLATKRPLGASQEE